MFINTISRPFIDAFEYPGRLLICVDTYNRQDCGVFAARDFGNPGLRHVRQPLVEVPDWSGGGFEVFEVAGFPPAEPERVCQYPYVIIAWNMRELSYPKASEFAVHSVASGWYVSYGDVSYALDPTFPTPRKSNDNT